MSKNHYDDEEGSDSDIDEHFQASASNSHNPGGELLKKATKVNVIKDSDNSDDSDTVMGNDGKNVFDDADSDNDNIIK